MGRNGRRSDGEARVILNRCKEHNITISRKKLELGTELGFAGHIVSQNGISPDDDKYKAIKEFPAPKNLKDLIIPGSGKSISSICTRSSSHVSRPQAFPIPRDAVTNGNGDTTTTSSSTNFYTF